VLPPTQYACAATCRTSGPSADVEQVPAEGIQLGDALHIDDGAVAEVTRSAAVPTSG